MKTVFATIALLFCLAFGSDLYAQPSGYLGKRQTVELSVMYNPYSAFISFENGFKGNPGFGLSYRYASGQYVAIGASILHRSMGTFSTEGYTAASPTTQTSAVLELDLFSFMADYAIAPVGSYITLGLGAVRYSSVEEVWTFDGEFTGYQPREFNAIMGRFNYGYRYVFKDKFTLSPWTGIDVSSHDTRAAFGTDPNYFILPQNGIYMLWRAGINFGILY